MIIIMKFNYDFTPGRGKKKHKVLGHLIENYSVKILCLI